MPTMAAHRMWSHDLSFLAPLRLVALGGSTGCEIDVGCPTHVHEGFCAKELARLAITALVISLALIADGLQQTGEPST